MDDRKEMEIVPAIRRKQRKEEILKNAYEKNREKEYRVYKDSRGRKYAKVFMPAFNQMTWIEIIETYKSNDGKTRISKMILANDIDPDTLRPTSEKIWHR